MASGFVIEDEELGQLFVRTNSRARRMTFRTKANGVYVTIPSGTSLEELKNALRELRPRLRAARAKQARPLIDLNFRIDTELFKLTLTSGRQEHFLSRSKPGELQIICPSCTDFTDADLQLWLRKVIEEALRRNAKQLLPLRLHALSLRHGLPYRSVKINSSSGRWGSCSSNGNINLSFYLILLPEHLVDYVLLHELSHTREMNHGERFWILLSRLTEGKTEALRQELKQYRTDIF